MDSFRNIRDGGFQKVETAADRLALLPADGDIVEQLDTHSLYSYDSSTNTWLLISQPAVGELVTSVFGRTGDVLAQTGDYSGDQITQDSTHRFVTDTEKTTWNGKENAITAGTTAQYWRGDKSFRTLDKAAVGLSSVDDTSDVNKPISTATQNALNLITNVNWTGDYNNGTTYNVGDGVMFNGASFRMINFIGAAGYPPPAYPGSWLQVTDYVSPNDIGLGNVPNVDATDPANIIQTSSYRFVSDTEKSTWNAKQDALGFTPENVINKATDLLSPNNTTYPTTLAVSNSISVVSTALVDMKEPNGFINRTDSTISFDHTSRTFTISPVSGSYGIYVASVKHVITTSKSVTIPNTTGNYFFYIDSSANLAYTTTFDASLIAILAYCAFIYWDSTGTGIERIVTLGDERHGITMDGKTHAYLHTTRGAAFGNGCGLTNFTINAGNNNADAQFTASSGLIWDEDIQFDLLAQTQFPVLYRINGSWKKKTADAFPLIYNGVAGYTGTKIAYNLNTAGIWSLAQVQNNKFILMHIFATNDVSTPFISILGQAEYNDKTSARAAAYTELQLISGLPVTEFVAIGSIVYETSNSYTNTPKARVVNINSENYVDYRPQIVRLGVLD